MRWPLSGPLLAVAVDPASDDSFVTMTPISLERSERPLADAVIRGHFLPVFAVSRLMLRYLEVRIAHPRKVSTPGSWDVATSSFPGEPCSPMIR